MTKLNLIAEPGKHEVIITRDVNAPRELVFKAFTDPKLMAQWWGQDTSTTIVDKMEVRTGGIWRYVSHDAGGNEYGFYGVYHQISAPERLVYTFEFEGMPGHVVLQTITLEEHNGKTTITDASVFQSVADRDGMLQSGMEDGAAESYDRLDRVLATLLILSR
jgi:uncharacterized protein YndB with AHSA1/START domain